MSRKYKLTKEQKERRIKKRYYERIEAFEEGRLNEPSEIILVQEMLNKGDTQFLNERVSRVVTYMLEKGLVYV